MGAVSNGQAANENTFNAAFGALLFNNSFKAKINLEDVDAGSGPSISNLQLVLNTLLSDVDALETLVAALTGGYDVSEVQAIDNTGAITLGTKKRQLLRVAGNGGAVTTSNTPLGDDWSGVSDFTEVVIYSTSANTVKIPFADIDYGAKLNGPATLAPGQFIKLFIDKTLLRLIEVGRSYDV